MSRIGVDIDGVLAAFDQPYENLLASLHGTEPRTLPADGAETWNFDTEYYPKKVVGRAWQHIETSLFWLEIPPTPEMSVFAQWFRASKHDVYFVTARPGKHVKQLTEVWLRRHLCQPVTVLISPRKGAVAHALKLHFYIDDRAENIEDVVLQSPDTRAYLLDRAYNRHIHAGIRIYALQEFLDATNTG